MVALICVGAFLDTLGTDTVTDLFETSSWARMLGWLLALFLLATALGLWYASVRYVLLTDELVLPRAVVVVIAVLGNATFAFFYYWLAVHWRQETRRLLRRQAA